MMKVNADASQHDAMRVSAIMAGVLFIIGTVAGALSSVLVIEDPGYLIKISASANQITRGSFFQFIMAAAYVGIAISLYPILRKYNETLAFGFACFRIIAGAFLFIGVVSLQLLLSLSQEFVKAGAPASSYFQTLGGLFRLGRDSMNHVAMILAVSLGGLLFYYMLFKIKLVPRWLSAWGLVGTILTIVASLLLMFRLIGLVTPVYLALNVPMALLEIVLALWLIVKGFNPPVTASASGKPIGTRRK
jgi:hypothetical protein